jgi:TetR/AcrR family transcriptional regulator
MSSANPSPLTWADRAADRSPAVQRSRARQMEQAKVVVDAARRLIAERGGQFTTQELVKEAGVALQTFYRLFAGKDQLLLAVFEDMIAEQCLNYEEAARGLPDPVARLRFYVTEVVRSVGTDAAGGIGPRFVTAEHWRLYQLFPEEMSHATQAFTDLVVRQLEAARDEGLLAPADPERDAWFVTNLVMAVFHHYAFASTPDAAAIGEQLWAFCRTALGGPSRVVP